MPGPAPVEPLTLEIRLAGSDAWIWMIPPVGPTILLPPCMGSGQPAALNLTGFQASDRPPIEGSLLIDQPPESDESDVTLEADRDLAGLVVDLPLVEECVGARARRPMGERIERGAVGGVPGAVERAAVRRSAPHASRA